MGNPITLYGNGHGNQWWQLSKFNRYRVHMTADTSRHGGPSPAITGRRLTGRHVGSYVAGPNIVDLDITCRHRPTRRPRRPMLACDGPSYRHSKTTVDGRHTGPSCRPVCLDLECQRSASIRRKDTTTPLFILLDALPAQKGNEVQKQCNEER